MAKHNFRIASNGGPADFQALLAGMRYFIKPISRVTVQFRLRSSFSFSSLSLCRFAEKKKEKRE